VKKFALEILSLVSRLINVLLGGSADITFSARSHVEELWTERWIDAVFGLFGEEDHCRKWWEWEVKRSRRNVARNEAEDWLNE
jgi:hypothetical protein